MPKLLLSLFINSNHYVIIFQHLKNAADDAFNEINVELGKFKAANSLIQISNIGESILNKVVMFSPILKKTPNKRETSIE